MERIGSDELRTAADGDWDVDMLESHLPEMLKRAAYTIDEMDKDMAIMEINREALRRALYEEQL